MKFRRNAVLGTYGFALLTLSFTLGVAYTAQNQPASQSQTAATAGSRFEVASIKLYSSDPVGWRLGHSIADPPNE